MEPGTAISWVNEPTIDSNFTDAAGNLLNTFQEKDLWLEPGFIDVGSTHAWLGLNGKLIKAPDRVYVDRDAALLDDFLVERLLPFQMKNRWGYRDLGGNIVIAPQFEAADFFFSKVARVRISGKWGYVDKTGTLVLPAQFDELKAAGFSAEGLAPAKQKDKWGFINQDGQFVIPPAWDDAGSFTDGRGLVAKMVNAMDNNSPLRWGAIDSKGDVKIPLRYNVVQPFAYAPGIWLAQTSVSSGAFAAVDQDNKPAFPNDWYFTLSGQGQYWVLFDDANQRNWGIYDLQSKSFTCKINDADEVTLRNGAFVCVIYSKKEDPTAYTWVILDLQGKVLRHGISDGNPFKN